METFLDENSDNILCASYVLFSQIDFACLTHLF